MKEETFYHPEVAKVSASALSLYTVVSYAEGVLTIKLLTYRQAVKSYSTAIAHHYETETFSSPLQWQAHLPVRILQP